MRTVGKPTTSDRKFRPIGGIGALFMIFMIGTAPPTGRIRDPHQTTLMLDGKASKGHELGHKQRAVKN